MTEQTSISQLDCKLQSQYNCYQVGADDPSQCFLLPVIFPLTSPQGCLSKIRLPLRVQSYRKLSAELWLRRLAYSVDHMLNRKAT